MKAKRFGMGLLIGTVTLVISFVLTFSLYIGWAVWRYPRTNSMAGLPAVAPAVVVAPVAAFGSSGLFLFWTGRKSEDIN